jgi:hypothetical protein
LFIGFWAVTDKPAITARQKDKRYLQFINENLEGYTRYSNLIPMDARVGGIA